jgi:hypothetical protein
MRSALPAVAVGSGFMVIGSPGLMEALLCAATRQTSGLVQRTGRFQWSYFVTGTTLIWARRGVQRVEKKDEDGGAVNSLLIAQ